MSSTAAPKGSTVLVTGVTGYIGSWVADEAIKQGYKVRGAVRTESKGKLLSEIFDKKYGPGKFEIASVPDMTAPGAYNEALKGVSAIIHLASDVSMSTDPEAVITPSVEGLRSILRAAKTEPSVKRFVLTSSSVAVSLPTMEKEFSFDSKRWNDDAIKQAYAAPPHPDSQAFAVYAASKALAEKAMWEFVEKEKPSFVANAVLPNFTMGPTLHDSLRSSTHNWLRGMYNNDPQGDAVMKMIGSQYWVSVEDIARLHVAGVMLEDVKNERLFGFTDKYTYNGFLEEMKKIDPKRTLPDPVADPGRDLSTVENGRAEEVLKLIGRPGWEDFEETFRANLA